MTHNDPLGKAQALALLLVAFTIAGALFWKFSTDHQRSQEYDQSLISPYLSLIQRGELAESYKRFTTDSYKSKHSLDDFKRYFLETFKSKGPLTSWEYIKMNEGYVIGDGSYIRLKYRINYKKGRVIVIYGLRPSKGQQLIDRSFVDVTGNMIKPFPQ